MATQRHDFTEEQRRGLFEFLAGNWFIRPDDDDAIVRKFITAVTPVGAAENRDLLRAFLNSSESDEAKAEFIRRSVERYLPGDSRVAVDWLAGILAKLEREIQLHCPGNSPDEYD